MTERYGMTAGQTVFFRQRGQGQGNGRPLGRPSVACGSVSGIVNTHNVDDRIGRVFVGERVFDVEGSPGNRDAEVVVKVVVVPLRPPLHDLVDYASFGHV